MIIIVCLLAIWLFALPLTILGVLALLPAAWILAFLTIVLAQQGSKNRSWIRTALSMIPFENHFESWTIEMQKPLQGLVVVFPHGIFCLGALLLHLRYHKTSYIAVASCIFYIPVIGYIARNIGCIPATEDAIRRVLGTPSSTLFWLPGGISELLNMERAPERVLHLPKRFGFLRLALEYGSRLTTIEIEGEELTYWCLPLPFLEMRKRWSEYIGVPLMFPWVFGCYHTWIPKKVKMRAKVLGVMDVIQKEPTRENVSQFKEKYIQTYFKSSHDKDVKSRTT